MAREEERREERAERSEHVESPEHYHGHHADQNMNRSVHVGHPINESHRPAPPAGRPGTGHRQNG